MDPGGANSSAMHVMLSAALTLLLVMDPFGNVAVWVPLLSEVPASRRRRVIVREVLAAMVLLAVFPVAGPPVLALLGIQSPALTVAGGVVLFLIAIRMIFPQQGGIFGEDLGGGEPLIVPLAVPLLAGPSAMATVTLLTMQRGTVVVLEALGIASAVSLAVLLQSDLISRSIGRRGNVAVQRLMGMLLTVIAVQMFLGGVREFMSLR